MDEKTQRFQQFPSVHSLCSKQKTYIGAITKYESYSSWMKNTREQGVVCHTMASPFTLKSVLMQKEESWKFKCFTMQKHNLQQNPPKENKNPSTYHNFITNLKFQHKPKHHLSKILI
jgi:hypothetical protein